MDSYSRLRTLRTPGSFFEQIPNELIRKTALFCQVRNIQMVIM
jgi:hypothetical protein